MFPPGQKYDAINTDNTKYIENNLNSLISSLNSQPQLKYYNNNDIKIESIKIVDTDKINVMKKQKRIANNREEIKIVFFD